MEHDEVMVLGATGLVGTHVVRHLRAAGHPVVAVARTPSSVSEPGVRWVRADVTRADDLSALPPCKLAVSTLTIWMTADVLPTLVDKGLTRLVAFSSSSAETKTDASDESERALAARLRHGEDKVKALAPALQSTILRPTMIYGRRGDANVERIADALRRFKFFPLVGGGKGLRQPVHAEDLGSAAVRALLTPGTEGNTYTLAGSEVLTVRAMVARVGEANGVRARFIRVPLAPAQWLLSVLGRLPRFRKVPAGALERMTKDLAFDNSPAMSDFGYAPRGFDPPVYG